MLFKDILDKKEAVLRPEFDKLFAEMLKDQKHPGDLLLILMNGSYEAEMLDIHSSVGKFSPYIIGPNREGHSESLHYEFIHNYRSRNIAAITHEKYLKKLTWSPEKAKEINELGNFEGTTIQLEMLIYLKIWEADAFIKKFYQFVRLIYSEPYDWHFKVAESSRDKDCTGTRQDILRKLIRDRIKTKYPAIYSAFLNAYKTQIRNSIAHSNYSFLGRSILLNNYVKEDPASQEKAVSFDEWIDKFHDTMIIYNEYLRLKHKIAQHYEAIAKNQGYKFEILITKKDNTTELRQVEFVPEKGDWRWDTGG